MSNYLDKTGLTYFWGKLKSYIIAIPNPANGRLAYHNDADFNAITEEWCLAKGVNSPDSAFFYYLHTIACMANSDGTVNVGKQIAFSYSSTDEEVYVRRRAGGTWTAWQKSPTRAEVDALNSKTGIDIDLSTVGSTNFTLTTNRSGKKNGIYVVDVILQAKQDISSTSEMNLGTVSIAPLATIATVVVRSNDTKVVGAFLISNNKGVYLRLTEPIRENHIIVVSMCGY